MSTRKIGTLLGPTDRPPGHGGPHDIDVSENENTGQVVLACRCGTEIVTTHGRAYNAARLHWIGLEAAS